MTGRTFHRGIIDSGFLLDAYCSGFFPMADPQTAEIQWFSPDPRGILDLEEFMMPRSLRQTVKKGTMSIRINERFEVIMRECARREETWISEDLIRSYVRLHELGFAHSVETWSGQDLAGGLYGVAIGGAFFGESMVSLQRDASKVALAALVGRLKERGYELLDSQYMTPHLRRFGVKEISRDAYMGRLGLAITKQCTFT